ncbi:hypothetical protein IWX49DRAFT_639521 [Phyllosticta citricarpa]|uniref:Uncharacterized protein n=2 Tax=Phyllosticta TaxID=121621 RepID=A0ABR1LE01_9PEZI
MTSTATATAKLRPLRSLHALAAEEEARISALTQPSATSICETNRKSSDTPNLPLQPELTTAKRTRVENVAEAGPENAVSSPPERDWDLETALDILRPIDYREILCQLASQSKPLRKRVLEKCKEESARRRPLVKEFGSQVQEVSRMLIPAHKLESVSDEEAGLIYDTVAKIIIFVGDESDPPSSFETRKNAIMAPWQGWVAHRGL